MTKSTSMTKKTIRNRTRLEWLLLAALIIIVFLWMASRYQWWPLNAPKDNLGTAFYTSRGVSVPDSLKQASQLGQTSNGTTSNASRSTTTNGSTATHNSSTDSTSNTGDSSSGGGGSSDSSSSTPLLSFAAGVNAGNSKQQIDATVNGLGENCAVTVNLPVGLGKQEVCTYTQNGGTVTVTYLNDRVLSASLAGL